MLRVLLLCALVGTAAAAEPAGFWYRVHAAEPTNKSPSWYYSGRCALDRDAMAAALAEGRPIVLEDLRCWFPDRKRTGPWIEFDANVAGSVILPADRILSIMPLKADPSTIEMSGGAKSSLPEL
jgi:hypothetical protein